MQSKIFIVGDKTTEAMDLEKWLNSIGFDVVGMGDVEDALWKIKIHKPDLILMDVQLNEGMDEIKIASKINDFNIPVIGLISDPEDSNVSNFISEDNNYLAKPINKTELKNTIELLLYKKQINQSLEESEKNYRELVDHSMVGVYKTRLNGEIIFANQALAEMFEFDKVEDIISRDVNDFYYNKEDRQEILKIIKKNGFLRQHELNMKTRNGKKITIIFSASLIGDNLSGMMMDITQRIEAERNLKENERKFRALIDKSTDIIRIFDADGKIIFDSPSSQRILGYEEGFFIGKNPIDFIHPDDQLKVENALKEVYDNKNLGLPTEFRILKADDTYIPVESLAQNLTDVPGIEGIVATTHPLTEQKKIEKALRKSRRLLADIINFLPDATFAIDLEGKIIAWNQAVEKMTGISTEKMMGKGNYEYAIPWYGERRPVLIDLIGKENLEFRTEYDFIEEDGHNLKAEIYVPSVYGGKGAYLWVKASPLLDNKGNQYGAIESVRDITERKKAEFALQRSEERFRALAESAVDLIITTDAEGTVLFSNKSLETMFSYSIDEVIGKKLTILMPDRLKKDYIEGLKGFKYSGEHIRVGKTTKTIGMRKDGSEFPFEMSLASWKSGGINFFTSIIRDITEREKAESLVVNSLNEKEILLKEIHHRVKNNLQIISSLLYLQASYVKEDKTAINVLKESQNRILSMAMIHEMLYQSEDLSHINFPDYLRRLSSNLFHTYGVEKHVKLNINAENSYLNVETSVPLGIIITEIISNSLKYAFPDDRTGELYISIKKLDNDFELVISDDGIGFPENMDFKNIKSSLGLQLVNSLVNQLDGTIEMDGNQGTKFIIKFKELKYVERV